MQHPSDSYEVLCSGENRLVRVKIHSGCSHRGDGMMHPIRYQVVGEEDYALMIHIDESGAFTISSGTYTSDRPRDGQLTEDQQAALLSAIRDLGIPQAHPQPEDAADAFKATLVIGEGESEVTYPFWEGALEEDAKLLKLVRLLEKL